MDGLAGVVEAGAEADARIGLGERRRGERRQGEEQGAECEEGTHGRQTQGVRVG